MSAVGYSIRSKPEKIASCSIDAVTIRLCVLHTEGDMQCRGLHWPFEPNAICVCAFVRYPVGVPHGGEWQLLLNSDDWKYAGGMCGMGNGSYIHTTQGGRRVLLNCYSEPLHAQHTQTDAV